MQDTNWLWWHASMPSHIVIEHDSVLWLVPYRPGGWESRAPYRGYQESLREVAPSDAQRLMAQHVDYPDDRLSLADAATLAGVDASTLRHAIRDERLTAEKVGRDWLIDRSEIERYMRERKPRPRRAE